METLLVLGTGTDVGKTYAACCIATQLRRSDPLAAVRALKPVESGVEASRQARDAAALAAAAGHPYVAPAHAFEEPLSPHLLARRSGLTLTPAALARWVKTESVGASWLIIETAGGAFSPLSPDACNADLHPALRAVGLKPTTVLIASNRLGVLHDVLATQRALEPLQAAAELIVLSTVTNAADPSALSNAEELKLLQPQPVIELSHGAQPPSLLAALRALRR